MITYTPTVHRYLKEQEIDFKYGSIKEMADSVPVNQTLICLGCRHWQHFFVNNDE